ncbi:MAG TPA: CDP-alcohol phosphatidyltransferase family protein, partial [Anaerolineaceae bacterium]|nr:CDP-alcohol phosphatidyltransferase family protein [Anaerolineaceae bacterium]
MLTRFRALYEKLSIPFGKASLKLHLTPNFWTLFSLFAALLGMFAFGAERYWLGLLMIVVMNLADMLDGATARAGNLGTAFGSVLDHCTDRYGEFMLVAGLMINGAVSPLLGMFAASGIVMASYVRAKAESMGGIKSCVVGLAGRQEKLILLVLAVIFFGVGWALPAQIMIA